MVINFSLRDMALIAGVLYMLQPGTAARDAGRRGSTIGGLSTYLHVEGISAA